MISTTGDMVFLVICTIFLVIFHVGVRIGAIKIDNGTRRRLVTCVIFLVIFYLSPFLIKSDFYDIWIEIARLFIAVHGAGMYWIGSRDKEDKE